MTTPIDAHGLWMKAKAHINRSFNANDGGDFEQAALWAAASLELLGKAALSKVNPLLVADPQDDGRSLLIAAGIISDPGRFKSIPAKAVFSRCARAFPPFSERDANLIAIQRNEELHSAVAPFTGIDEDLWWQRYWAQAVLLIQAQDKTVLDFVGSRREGTVEDYLERNIETVSRRVDALIQRASQRFTLAITSLDAQRQLKDLATSLMVAYEFSTTVTCPACQQESHLYGDVIEDSDVIIDQEDGSVTEIVTVFSEYFECDACGLRLTSSQQVDAAQLATTFEVERDYEPVWDDYGND